IRRSSIPPRSSAGPCGGSAAAPRAPTSSIPPAPRPDLDVRSEEPCYSTAPARGHGVSPADAGRRPGLPALPSPPPPDEPEGGETEAARGEQGPRHAPALRQGAEEERATRIQAEVDPREEAQDPAPERIRRLKLEGRVAAGDDDDAEEAGDDERRRRGPEPVAETQPHEPRTGQDRRPEHEPGRGRLP